MVKKAITVFILSLFFLFPSLAKAEGKIAGESATLNLYGQCKISQQDPYLLKNFVLSEFFKKHASPLAEKAVAFIFSCQKYRIDCYLLPSIASVESSYGKRYIKAYNNPFGWGGGYYKFESLEQAIEVVTKKMRLNYIDKGATNLQLIGKRYSADVNWWKKTNSVKNRLEKMERKYDLLLSYILVE